MAAIDTHDRKECYEHDDSVLKDTVSETGDYVPGSDAEKRLVRKIDLYLLPMMWIMYLLSYMDRTK